MGSLILLFAFTQGVFPKPPDFAKLNAFDLSYLAQHPRVHAVPAHAARRRRPGRLRAAERAREGVLGARAPGLHDPPGPRPLHPRGLPRAARRLVLPLRGLLDAARGLQRGRLGEERAARAGRERGLGRGAVHAAGGGRAAGAADEGVRRPRPRARPSPPTRWVSRSRSARSPSASASPRSSSSSATAASGR